MNARARAGWMLALVSLLGTAAGAWGQSFPRTLDDVKLFGKGETIQFVFSQPFEGTPAEDHRRGSVALTFVGVGNRIPARELRPKGGGHFKLIRLAENPYSTTVTLLYQESGLSLKDRLHFTRAGNVLTVEVRAPGAAASPPAAATPPEENRLLAEMEQKIGGGAASGNAPSQAPAPAPPTRAAPPALPLAAPSASAPAAGAEGPKGSAPAPAPPAARPGVRPPAGTTSGQLGLGTLGEGDFFTALATMVAALAFIVLGLYGVLYVYKRFFDHRLGRFTGGVAFKQVASFAVGPRQRIVILEINGEMIACGVTPAQITFLTRLTDGQAAGTPPAGGAAPGGGASGGKTGGTAADDPVQRFAALLKQKVRSMKPIQ